MDASFTEHLNAMKLHFESGVTRTYQFRLQQLQRLKKTILACEEEIYVSLFYDLKKSKEETYATELGIVISEINTAIKNLKRWMEPEYVPTDLVNLPSRSTIYRDPLGVVLIISPWNYPFQLLFNPLIGAIAGGNCAVLKPSEFAPATAAVIEKICNTIFPKQYIHAIQGDGSAVIPAMMSHFRFDHIFYTGSIPVGKTIYQMAAEKLIPVTLELGGKSPCIVEEDANINVAAKRIVLGKFVNAGQTCIAPDYILVHESKKEVLIEKMKEATEDFYDDAANSNDYGKIINEKRFDALINYLSDGTVVFGGATDRTKLFIAPTILTNVSLDAKVMREEIFGPVLPVLTFSHFEEALEVVKQNANPLAFYLFTNNKKKEVQWMQSVAFGGGCINNTDWHFTNHQLPFGGVGNSGIGAYHGKFTFDTFTRLKSVLKTPNWFDPFIKYPPFKGRLWLFKWLIR
jgi:aldehyde dehydrogenase (NAD+)